MTAHGFQHFAFMAGQPNHPHSKMRLQVCEEILARHGLAMDPELVVCGDFMTHAAEVAMDELLAQRGDFEVVVAANDAMALGVIASLSKHMDHMDLPAKQIQGSWWWMMSRFSC